MARLDQIIDYIAEMDDESVEDLLLNTLCGLSGQDLLDLVQNNQDFEPLESELYKDFEEATDQWLMANEAEQREFEAEQLAEWRAERFEDEL